jgi:hypothetical protein
LKEAGTMKQHWKMKIQPIVNVECELPENVDVFLPQFRMSKREFDLMCVNAVIRLMKEIEEAK